MVNRLFILILLFGVSFLGCTSSSRNNQKDSDFSTDTFQSTCDIAAQSTVGPSTFADVDFFSCPQELNAAADVSLVTDPLNYSNTLFNELWQLALRYLDKSQIVPCTEASDSITCETAEYVDERGIDVVYSVYSDSGGIVRIQDKQISVVLPPGMATWTTLSLELHSDGYGNTSGEDNYENTASWTGTIKNGWPTDSVISSSGSYSYTAAELFTSSRRWESPGCAISESYAPEGVLDTSSVPHRFVVNNASFQTFFENGCEDFEFDILRVNIGGECVGLVRSDSLEYVDSCSSSCVSECKDNYDTDDVPGCGLSCPDNSNCEQVSTGEYLCVCKLGYVNDGTACVQETRDDDCRPTCGPNAICDKSSGTPVCTCNESFYGNGFVCWPDTMFVSLGNGAVEFEQFVTGDGFSCALHSDGSAQCWGQNIHNESMVPGETAFQTIAAGAGHVCGLRLDGTAQCWGDNEYGQATAPEDEVFAQIFAGRKRTCGIREDGTTRCWGEDGDGEYIPPQDIELKRIAIGDEYTCGLPLSGIPVCWGNVYYDASAFSSEVNYEDISTGEDFTCVLLGTGEVDCWRRILIPDAPSMAYPLDEYRFSQLSADVGLMMNGSALYWNTTGMLTLWWGKSFSSVSAGWSHRCGMQTDGRVLCDGDNTNGQSLTPTKIPLVQFSAGDQSSDSWACFLDANGNPSCWGAQGETVNPYMSDFYDNVFTQIAVGHEHVCGLKADGSAICEGVNINIGYNDVNYTPQEEEAFTQIAAGDAHTCGLKANGIVRCWGKNDVGQAVAPEDALFTQISADASRTCGLHGDGSVECWGAIDWFGANTAPDNVAFTQISAGRWHTCGIRTDGIVSCWGDNLFQQSDAPSNIIFSEVSAGQTHTCGITSLGTVFCWGDNTFGQSSPPMEEVFTSVTARTNYSCGIRKNDGTEICWGMLARNMTD